MKKNKAFTYFIFLFALTLVTSLSGNELEHMRKIYETEKATYGDAIDILAMQTDLYSEGETTEIRLQKLNEKYGISLKEEKLSRPLAREAFAGMAHRIFPVPKGLLYSTTHLNRYAYRDWQAEGLFGTGKGPYSKMSGPELLGIVDEALRYEEARNQTNENMEAEK